uniref:Uncharacterized protein n=2 Tax=Panagrolaimus sp. JU765 TaxID=591449 RepID=A0AC34RFW4_9BILA
MSVGAYSPFSLNSSYSEGDETEVSSSSHLDSLTISPPSYSVRETPDGRFFNTTLNITWPKRPIEGYYSTNEYYKRKAEMVALRTHKWVEHFKRGIKRHPEVFSLLHPEFVNEAICKSPKWFFGQVSPMKVAQEMVPQTGIVFYPLLEPDLNDVPQALNPIFAYKTQKNQVYLFELEFIAKKDVWVLSFPGYRSPGFSQMRQLVDYVRSTGFISPETGRIECLPVWHVDNAMTSV